MSNSTPDETRWCDWIATLEPHDQNAHDLANWPSCQAFCGGIESERARLQPLLERALEFATAQDLVHPFAVTSAPGKLLADLRREMGKGA